MIGCEIPSSSVSGVFMRGWRPVEPQKGRARLNFNSSFSLSSSPTTQHPNPRRPPRPTARRKARAVEGWADDTLDEAPDEAVLSALGWTAKHRGVPTPADPSQACTNDVYTALICAANLGQLAVPQLLLLFGADPDVRCQDGRSTAQSIALESGPVVPADCPDTIADWPHFKIAAVCRHHADARRISMPTPAGSP